MNTGPEVRLAIFCSGGGSNAAAILKYFARHKSVSVQLLVGSKQGIGAYNHAKTAGIPFATISYISIRDKKAVLELLRLHDITHIVLAGWLVLIPKFLIEAFERRIINIHPSLLPAFGGKGMHGTNVHQAVSDAGVTSTGCTIHLVNEHYDEGQILFQKQISITPHLPVDKIAAEVLKLEHAHYAPVIEQWAISHI